MPFSILHVCVGNICRSPMSERLLALALSRQVDGDAFHNHGAGTGSWHIGEPMNPPAARQLVVRGAQPDGFAARKLSSELIETSDLILCATSQQVAGVLSLVPDALGRTFVLGEFGRLLSDVDLSSLPAFSPADPHDRGVALLAADDALRSDPKDPAYRRRSRDDDHLHRYHRPEHLDRSRQQRCPRRERRQPRQRGRARQR